MRQSDYKRIAEALLNKADEEDIVLCGFCRNPCVTSDNRTKCINGISRGLKELVEGT